jgi:hypothetical protein
MRHQLDSPSNSSRNEISKHRKNQIFKANLNDFVSEDSTSNATQTKSIRKENYNNQQKYGLSNLYEDVFSGCNQFSNSCLLPVLSPTIWGFDCLPFADDDENIKKDRETDKSNHNSKSWRDHATRVILTDQSDNDDDDNDDDDDDDDDDDNDDDDDDDNDDDDDDDDKNADSISDDVVDGGDSYYRKGVNLIAPDKANKNDEICPKTSSLRLTTGESDTIEYEARIIAPNVDKLSPTSVVEIRLQSADERVAILCSVDVLKMRSIFYHEVTIKRYE